MESRRKILSGALLPLGLLLAVSPVFAQRPGGAPSTTQPPQPPQPSNMPMSTTTNAQPTEMVKPPSKQETKAYKAFHETQPTDADKKTQLGEEFIQNYPDSRYRPEVVMWLARAYASKRAVDKLQAEGEKELALKPNNPASLAILGTNLARATTSSTPNQQAVLAQAENLCKKSLDVLATVQKPADRTEEQFTQAKNQTAGLAHSGLGTVAFFRANYADAIQELQQAVKLNGGADPVDFYLLGKANEASTNFSEALDAYTKCAAIPGGMQAPCQSSAQEMKTHGAVLPK